MCSTLACAYTRGGLHTLRGVLYIPTVNVEPTGPHVAAADVDPRARARAYKYVCAGARGLQRDKVERTNRGGIGREMML